MTKATKMTNTDRLIYNLEFVEKHGGDHITYMVGRCTGNGPSVTNALRKRGFKVTKVPAGGVTCYRLERME